MNYSVVDVAPGARGFDTIAALTADQYTAMYALGFTFRWGYLGDLHTTEIDTALANRVGIMVIQHARAVGWTVTQAKGAEDGARAVRDALSAKLPQALPLWCDLESPATTATADDIAAYSDAWCQAVHGAGHNAEVYVGFGLPCDAEHLWELPFTGYASSFSNVATPAHRGFKMRQLFASYPKGECFVRDAFPHAPANVAGLQIDIDITQTDFLGSKPKMLVAV
jgi:hypothetical protein